MCGRTRIGCIFWFTDALDDGLLPSVAIRLLLPQVSVGTRFYVWIKYMVAAPVALLCAPLLLLRKPKT